MSEPRKTHFAPLLRVLFTITGIWNFGGYVGALIEHSADARSYLAMSIACLAVVFAANLDRGGDTYDLLTSLGWTPPAAPKVPVASERKDVQD